jgi:hypothetical protein
MQDEAMDADVERRRWSRRRLAATAVAFAVFATTVVFAWYLFHPDHQDRRPSDSRSSQEGVPNSFIPQGAESDGDLIRLPLVFPDGSRVMFVYPGELRLTGLGIQPDASYLWADDPAPRFPIVFMHDPAASIAAYVDGAEPTAKVDDPRGPIEIWAMASRWESKLGLLQGAWVRYPLGSWTVLAASRTIAKAYEVADYLRVLQTDEGFPVVDVVGPIELAEGFGEAGGAQLAFGDGTADPDTVSQLDTLILLSPDGCTPATDSEFSGGYGSACLGDGNVFASIYGDRDFVTRLIEGLRVEDFRQT